MDLPVPSCIRKWSDSGGTPKRIQTILVNKKQISLFIIYYTSTSPFIRCQDHVSICALHQIGTVSVAQHYVGGCGKGRCRSRCRGSKSRTSDCGHLTSGVAHHPDYYQTGHVTVTHVSVDGTNVNTGS